jgi:hypothetical protein
VRMRWLLVGLAVCLVSECPGETGHRWHVREIECMHSSGGRACSSPRLRDFSRVATLSPFSGHTSKTVASLGVES